MSHKKPQLRSHRLSISDALRTAFLGPISRPLRTILSALGIAVGIASLTAITGISASNQAQIRQEFIDKGANLLTITPGWDPQGQEIPIPDTAPAMVSRIAPVQQVGVLEKVPEYVKAYRTDLVPAGQSNGIQVLAAGPSLLATVEGELAQGRWFDDASRRLPTVVLGKRAAEYLGVHQVGGRIWVNGQWYAVIGVLSDSGLLGQMDTVAFLGDIWARENLPFQSEPSSATPTKEPLIGAANTASPIQIIFVRTYMERLEEVRNVLAQTVNPSYPQGVQISSPSDWAEGLEVTGDALSQLAFGLAGVALLVGGIGIANTMVVAVLERRGEIGLRRALGARSGQIAGQFVLEAVLLGAIGGVVGALLGITGVFIYTKAMGQITAISLTVTLIGPLVSVGVGALAGLYPALRAARQSPTTALRAI